MLTFKEFLLQEMPFAEFGDYSPEDGEDLTGGNINIKNDDYKKFNFSNDIILYQQNKSDFLLVKDNKIILNASFKNYNDLPYKNLLKVSYIFVDKNFRGKGLAKSFYIFLVKTLNYSILSDEQQYFGARKLWSSLSKIQNISIDLINFNTSEVLEKKIKFIHGENELDFDKKYYTNNYSKFNDFSKLRFVLYV